MNNIIKHVTLVAICSSTALAEEFGGIEFPQGASSFADEVISYNPNHSGGPAPTDPNFLIPNSALGAPDYLNSEGAVSLGSGGRITLKFINNQLTGSDSPSPDLHVFEIGPDVEDTFVEISTDGVIWHSVGKVFGSTSSIDIDAFGFGSSDSFAYVRLTDDPDEGNRTGDTVGADIDSVGAISTSNQVHLPTLSIETSVMVSFPTLEGSTYTIEESIDLENWADSVSGIIGNGEIQKYFFEVSTPKKFYRIKDPE